MVEFDFYVAQTSISSSFLYQIQSYDWISEDFMAEVSNRQEAEAVLKLVRQGVCV